MLRQEVVLLLYCCLSGAFDRCTRERAHPRMRVPEDARAAHACTRNTRRHGCDGLISALERSHLCPKSPGIPNLFLAKRRAHLNGFDRSVHPRRPCTGAGIRRVGLLLRRRFVRTHRFELLHTPLRRCILRLLCNSVCVRIIGDAVTLCAVAGLAWRRCRIRRART